jgi:hypothetical protein
MKQRLYEVQTTLVKADRLQISRTLANENDISAAAERQPF